jgi:hypothetical protein
MIGDLKTIIDWQNHNPDAARALIEGTAAVIPLKTFGARPDSPWAEFLTNGCYRKQLAEERLDKHDSMGKSNQPFYGEL